LEPYRSAAQEAYEEAGVRGTVAMRPIGSYVYDKFVDKKAITVPCELRVFKLHVEFQEENWPERAQRELRWFRMAEAIAAAEESGLKELLSKFECRRAQKIKKAA
jgi:8-oxo-dGTP pyrophosphatase MutT (NUDIX family)